MRSLAFASALVAGVLCRQAFGEPEPLTFRAFVHETLSASPEAAQIDSALAERVADAFAVGVRENPVLSAGVDLPVDSPDDAKEDPELSITLSQAIRRSDLGDRVELANLMEESAGLEKILALSELIHDVGLSYSRVWQFQQTQSMLVRARERTEKIARKLSGSSTGGLFGEGELQLIRAEVANLEAQEIAANADAVRAAAELTRISGVGIGSRRLSSPKTETTLTRDDVERLVRESRLPVQKRFELLKKLATKRLEVARQDSMPAISPSLGYGRHDDGTSQVVLGFSVPLPLFNRNQAEEMRASGALAAAEAGARFAASDALLAEALLRFDAASSLRRQIAVYDEKIIPATERAVSAFLSQFERGAGAPFQIVQAQRENNESRRRLLELQALLAVTVAELDALLGIQEL